MQAVKKRHHYDPPLPEICLVPKLREPGVASSALDRLMSQCIAVARPPRFPACSVFIAIGCATLAAFQRQGHHGHGREPDHRHVRRGLRVCRGECVHSKPHQREASSISISNMRLALYSTLASTVARSLPSPCSPSGLDRGHGRVGLSTCIHMQSGYVGLNGGQWQLQLFGPFNQGPLSTGFRVERSLGSAFLT